MAAKLWGLHDGLTLARNPNIHKLLVEVDASVVENFFHWKFCAWHHSHL